MLIVTAILIVGVFTIGAIVLYQSYVDMMVAYWPGASLWFDFAYGLLVIVSFGGTCIGCLDYFGVV